MMFLEPLDEIRFQALGEIAHRLRIGVRDEAAALSARSRSTTERRSRTSFGLDLWLWSQPFRFQSGKLI
jgi:hypothetical protein